MKKLLFLFSLALLFSCSVQKRKYQNGYYVDWHNKASHKGKEQSLAEKPALKEKRTVKEEIVIHSASQVNDQEMLASGNNTSPAPEFRKRSPLLSPPEDSCDVLVFKDGSEIKAKVNEIGATEIKYKRCDATEGPTYISRKSELFMIKYSNGTREVIKSDPPPQQAPTYYQGSPSSSYKQRYQRKENHPLAIAALVLGILAIVLAYITLLLIAFGFGAGVLALPFLAAVAAVISGKTALNRIKEQPDVYKGKGMAIPGFIMGIIIAAIYLTVFALIGLFAGI